MSTIESAESSTVIDINELLNLLDDKQQIEKYEYKTIQDATDNMKSNCAIIRESKTIDSSNILNTSNVVEWNCFLEYDMISNLSCNVPFHIMFNGVQQSMEQIVLCASLCDDITIQFNLSDEKIQENIEFSWDGYLFHNNVCKKLQNNIVKTQTGIHKNKRYYPFNTPEYTEVFNGLSKRLQDLIVNSTIGGIDSDCSLEALQLYMQSNCMNMRRKGICCATLNPKNSNQIRLSQDKCKVCTQLVPTLTEQTLYMINFIYTIVHGLQRS